MFCDGGEDEVYKGFVIAFAQVLVISLMVAHSQRPRAGNKLL